MNTNYYCYIYKQILQHISISDVCSHGNNEEHFPFPINCPSESPSDLFSGSYSTKN